MSRPMDQIDNSSTKPLQTEHHGQMSSRRSQSDVRLENCESQARQLLPNSLTASQHGPVTLLRLSRPAKRNALDDATIAGIESFFSDPPEETRAIILHGEGKHFSAGADLSAVIDVSAPASVRRSRSWYRAFDRIENGHVPVVAALHGAVICNQPSILQFLVDRGAKLDAQSRLGWTPLTLTNGIFMANSKKEFPVAREILKKAMAQKGLLASNE